MVKNISLFIMVFSIFLSCHKNKTSNDLILKKEYIGGKKSREFYVLSSNEKIKNGFYREFWLEKGSVFIQGNYLNNFREGIFYRFYENGNLESIENYRNGKLFGLREVFYETGNIERIDTFYNNLLINVISLRDTSGKELDKGTFKNGDGRLNNYSSDGKLQFGWEIRNSKIIKTIEYYYLHPGKVDSEIVNNNFLQ